MLRSDYSPPGNEAVGAGGDLFLAPALSIVIATVSQMIALFAFFAAALTALWIWVRRERRQGWGEAKLIYDDDPEALANLGLKS
jgi:Zn-dependent protease with chaperone function